MLIQRKFGLLGRVMLAYEEAEYKEKSVLRRKGMLEFMPNETFKAVQLSMFDQDEPDFNFPKLLSFNLTEVLLIDDLTFLNLTPSLINEANGILPKISQSRNLTFIRIVDDRPLIEFAPDSREVFFAATYASLLPQTLSLNLTLSHFRFNSSLKGFSFILLYLNQEISKNIRFKLIRRKLQNSSSNFSFLKWMFKIQKCY